MQPGALKELVEGKFVDALRAVAAEMAMEELHEQRVNFVQKVQPAVSEDILKNGLELESVSLTGLDQTGREYLQPGQRLRRRRSHPADPGDRGAHASCATTSSRKPQVADPDARTSTPSADARQIARDVEYARLEQEREVEIRRAEQAR